VLLYQPALAHYRVPVFRALAARPGIELKVRYGTRPNLKNVTPDGFVAAPSRPRLLPVTRAPLIWDSAQFECVDRSNADVAIFPWDLHYTSLPAALVMSRVSGVGTVLWGHGYSKTESTWRRRARNTLGKLSDVLLLYDRTTADRLVREGAAATRVFTAPNALDQEPIQAAAQPWRENTARLREFRTAQGLSGPVLIFVSRLLAENRVDWLIEATAALRRKFPELATVIVGDGPARKELEQLAQSRGVGAAVRFAGAIYDEESIAPWMCAADLFVYPTNIGLSLLHAFGYGLPVVVGDDRSRQNPEIDALRPGENGLVYRQGDCADLTRVIATVLSEPAQLRTLAAAALATATQDRTLAAMVDGIEAAIRKANSLRVHPRSSE
jgi:glycosyltransferase involved in cell wall biosynthesis